MSRIIPIHALRAALPSVDLGDAGVHQVKAITGAGMQLMVRAREASDALALWEVAALCLPTASAAQVFGLELVQVEQVVAIATGQADQVMAALGNAPAPAETTPPAPPPTTPSGT